MSSASYPLNSQIPFQNEFEAFRILVDKLDLIALKYRGTSLIIWVLLWAEEEARLGTLPQKAGRILEAILYRGELPQGEVSGLLDASDRHARRAVAALMEYGVVVSKTTRAPLHLAFPAKMAE